MSVPEPEILAAHAVQILLLKKVHRVQTWKGILQLHDDAFTNISADRQILHLSVYLQCNSQWLCRFSLKDFLLEGHHAKFLSFT
jgi:hypothetical protein